MLTLVTMDPGHTVAELFTADGHRAVDRPSRRSSTRRDQVAQRRHPAHRAAVERQPRHAARTATSTQSVAGKILAADLARETSTAGQAARNASTRLATHRRASTRSRRRSARSTTRSTSTSCSTTTRCRTIRKPIRSAPAVLPRRPPRADGRAAARQRVDQGRGQGRRPRDRDAARRCTSTTRTIITTGAPVLLENINNYLTGGMLDARRDRDRDHDADPAACCSTCGGGCSPLGIVLIGVDLGVRHRRLPRHPADDRHDLRPAR